MTNKTNKQKQKKTAEVTKLQNKLKNMKVTKKATPFADVGSTLGKSVGSLFGNGAVGSGIGKWLGSGIGSIFGSGDYELSGSKPAYNVLANGNQIPKFDSTKQTNIVCHREYLGDIYGTTAFNNNTFPLNPGISTTFPWLSTLAGNYQEYKFHGLIFEFRPLTTDYANSGVPGVVVLSTNYNADVPSYATKQEMENAEFAVSTKPTLAVMHPVECAVGLTINPTKYIRSGAVPSGQDLRLYDQGLFQFATQGNSSTVDLGELWVSYCVEFFKPVLPDVVAGGNTDHYLRTSVNGLTVFGPTALITAVSQIGTVVSANVLTFPANVSGTFQLTIVHVGTAAVFGGFGNPTAVGCTVSSNVFTNHTANYGQAPSGVSSANVSYTLFVTVPPVNAIATLTFAATVAPTNSNIDVIVTSVTQSIA